MFSSEAIAFLKRLLDAPGPSGFETLAGRAWRAEAEKFADDVTVDIAGNCIAEINPGGSPTILIDGHIDEIGVIVQYIDDQANIVWPKNLQRREPVLPLPSSSPYAAN